jgi:hypothetical protein
MASHLIKNRDNFRAMIAQSVQLLGYGLDDRGSRDRFPAGGWEFFSSPSRPERLCGPPSLLSNGYQGLFPWGVKRPGREADHSPPSSAEVKECVELYLHSPNTHSWRGAQLKYRDKFTSFYLYQRQLYLYVFRRLGKLKNRSNLAVNRQNPTFSTGIEPQPSS